MEGKTTVAILSNNRLLRESIAHILEANRDMQVIHLDSDTASFGGDEASFLPQVWVSDSLHCFTNSLLPRLKLHERGAEKCVLIAMEDDPRKFLRAVACGILGYVLEEGSAAEVVGAIRAVARGEAVCPPHLSRVLFDYVSSHANNPQNGSSGKVFRLTRREQQLIPLVSRGLTNKEIAAELNVSEQTIKSHIHRILRKVGVGDRVGLAAVCEITQLEA